MMSASALRAKKFTRLNASMSRLKRQSPPMRSNDQERDGFQPDDT
jgi:hypothetical protein